MTRGETARDRLATLVPSLASKRVLRGVATAYVCESGRCELPTTEPDTLAQQLAEVVPLAASLPPLPVAKPEPEPEPWEYDADNDRHYHPGHGHWHDGPPPSPTP